jgi:hypothetical protein
VCRPGLRLRQKLVDRAYDVRPFDLIVVIARQPAVNFDFWQPRHDVGPHVVAVVACVQVYPVDRSVGKERGRGDRVGDDERDEVIVPAVDDVPVEQARQRAFAEGNGRAMVVLSCRTFDAAPAARVDANQSDGLAALSHYVGQRAETAAQKVADLDKPAAVRKPVGGLFLRRSPFEPARYVVPVHATTTETAITLESLEDEEIANRAGRQIDKNVGRCQLLATAGGNST